MKILSSPSPYSPSNPSIPFPAPSLSLCPIVSSHQLSTNPPPFLLYWFPVLCPAHPSSKPSFPPHLSASIPSLSPTGSEDLCPKIITQVCPPHVFKSGNFLPFTAQTLARGYDNTGEMGSLLPFLPRSAPQLQRAATAGKVLLGPRQSMCRRDGFWGEHIN